jgi:hypothetical protein
MYILGLLYIQDIDVDMSSRFTLYEFIAISCSTEDSIQTKIKIT